MKTVLLFPINTFITCNENIQILLVLRTRENTNASITMKIYVIVTPNEQISSNYILFCKPVMFLANEVLVKGPDTLW